MERINAYTRADGHGNTVIDAEGMAVDLITIMKAGGHSKDEFLALLSETWEQVQVSVDLSQVNKQ